MNAKGIAVVLGLIIVLAGLILGVAGTSARMDQTNIFDGSRMGSQSLGCGSVFSPKSYEHESVTIDLDRAEVASRCDDAVGSRAPFVWVMLGVGVLVAAGGLMYRSSRLVS